MREMQIIQRVLNIIVSHISAEIFNSIFLMFKLNVSQNEEFVKKIFCRSVRSGRKEENMDYLMVKELAHISPRNTRNLQRRSRWNNNFFNLIFKNICIKFRNSKHLTASYLKLYRCHQMPSSCQIVYKVISRLKRRKQIYYNVSISATR